MNEDSVVVLAVVTAGGMTEVSLSHCSGPSNLSGVWPSTDWTVLGQACAVKPAEEEEEEEGYQPSPAQSSTAQYPPVTTSFQLSSHFCSQTKVATNTE